MKSILHVIDTGGSGGAETVFLNIATRLSPDRFRSIAMVGGDGWLAARLRERGIDPVIAPAKGSFNVAYLLGLMKIIRRERPAAIIAHLYGSAIYASVAGRLCRTPVLSVLHGQSDVNPDSRFAAAKAAIVRLGSAGVVFVSENLRDDLAPKLGLDRRRCVVVTNGVDLEAFSPGSSSSLRQELRLPEGTLIVGSIGNIRVPKAYDVLLRAAAQVLAGTRDVHFAIAGDCSGRLAEKLLALRAELGLDRQVTFLGLRADVANLLRNFDVFALSSRTEGFSIACIEAMACGVPVVSTRSGGPQQILEGGCGELVAVDEPAELAAAILRLLSSPDRRVAMAKAALDRVHERYSLATMLSRYEALLDSLIAPDPARAS
jgi:glycosyltransferase involved in cell wall biosynthesis